MLNSLTVLAVTRVCHDASVSLIHRGRVWAIELERLSGLRMHFDKRRAAELYLAEDYDGLMKLVEAPLDEGLVQRAVDYVLDAAGLERRDVDVVYDGDAVRGLDGVALPSHHAQHAASAYYPSGFDEAAVLVCDGSGDPAPGNSRVWEAVSFHRGQGAALTPLRTIHTPESYGEERFCSLGFFYGTITLLCGFFMEEDGKLMGLAGHGTDRYTRFLRAFVSRDDTGTWWFREALRGAVAREIEARGGGWEVRADFAYAAQHVFEEVVLDYCRQARALTGSDCLCLAGGSFLNSVVNGKIREATGFRDVFVQPAANDGGPSLGMALSLFYARPENAHTRLDYNGFFLGRSYSDEDIRRALDHARGISVVALASPEEAAVECGRRLTEGGIVGWFQGRSELGPRALGNRSILCDPRRADARDALNRTIKFREWFRPFAAMVLEERAGEWFDIDFSSPHMLMVRAVTSDRIPAVTHADGTARIQTLARRDNPLAHLVVETFAERTGVPLVLNTSFNTKGKPLVETPEDAVRTLMTSKLDGFYIGRYWVTRAEARVHTVSSELSGARDHA